MWNKDQFLASFLATGYPVIEFQPTGSRQEVLCHTHLISEYFASKCMNWKKGWQSDAGMECDQW